MIAWLLQEYMSQKNLNLNEITSKLGFHQKIVWNWLHLKHCPNKFSAQCILDLFIKEKNQNEVEQYKEYFWKIWNIDKLNFDSRLRKKHKKLNYNERLTPNAQRLTNKL